jgi:hypothetical protein
VFDMKLGIPRNAESQHSASIGHTEAATGSQDLELC